MSEDCKSNLLNRMNKEAGKIGNEHLEPSCDAGNRMRKNLDDPLCRLTDLLKMVNSGGNSPLCDIVQIESVFIGLNFVGFNFNTTFTTFPDLSNFVNFRMEIFDMNGTGLFQGSHWNWGQLQIPDGTYILEVFFDITIYDSLTKPLTFKFYADDEKTMQVCQFTYPPEDSQVISTRSTRSINTLSINHAQLINNNLTVQIENSSPLQNYDMFILNGLETLMNNKDFTVELLDGNKLNITITNSSYVNKNLIYRFINDNGKVDLPFKYQGYNIFYKVDKDKIIGERKIINESVNESVKEIIPEKVNESVLDNINKKLKTPKTIDDLQPDNDNDIIHRHRLPFGRR